VPHRVPTLPPVGRRLGTAAVFVLLFVLSGTAAAQTHSYIGSMHEHSAYSDGWPGSRPFGYYMSGRNHGLDFMGGSDHSDNLGLPNSDVQSSNAGQITSLALNNLAPMRRLQFSGTISF